MIRSAEDFISTGRHRLLTHGCAGFAKIDCKCQTEVWRRITVYRLERYIIWVAFPGIRTVVNQSTKVAYLGCRVASSCS